MDQHDGIAKTVGGKLWLEIVVATVVFLTTMAFILFYSSNLTIMDEGPEAVMLTFSSGKRIKLNNDKTGLLWGEKRNSAIVLRYNDGVMVSPTDFSEEEFNLHNPQENQVLSTPKGKQYQITLGDGTRIWLNADSKVSFPSEFSDPFRKVLLDGEAYFEVAKNVKPFLVVCHQQEVEVLGTHFNVNAYSDEKNIKTTILTGLVRINTSGLTNAYESGLLLLPGEQAVNSDGVVSVHKVNPDDALCWRDQVFIFNGGNLERMMKVVARWYDLNIIYSDFNLKKIELPVRVPRLKNLAALLKTVEETGKVKFKLQGKTLTITKP